MRQRPLAALLFLMFALVWAWIPAAHAVDRYEDWEVEAIVLSGRIAFMLKNQVEHMPTAQASSNFWFLYTEKNASPLFGLGLEMPGGLEGQAGETRNGTLRIDGGEPFAARFAVRQEGSRSMFLYQPPYAGPATDEFVAQSLQGNRVTIALALAPEQVLTVEHSLHGFKAAREAVFNDHKKRFIMGDAVISYTDPPGYVDVQEHYPGKFAGANAVLNTLGNRAIIASLYIPQAIVPALIEDPYLSLPEATLVGHYASLEHITGDEATFHTFTEEVVTALEQSIADSPFVHHARLNIPRLQEEKNEGLNPAHYAPGFSFIQNVSSRRLTLGTIFPLYTERHEASGLTLLSYIQHNNKTCMVMQVYPLLTNGDLLERIGNYEVILHKMQL